MKATRTLNPLHFEDLEPHRFEDLVRQLVYDFREWHSLEALGRPGSDEGMDIRGYEHLGDSLVDSEGEPEPEAFKALELREWRIQCKREQRLGPKRVEEAVAELLKSTEDPPYGVVIAAACDFSKRARETFRSECLARGVEEFHLWGKGELEDLLFRPSNDHLLWAYFGVSLRVRRRSVTTILNKRMTTKRRLAKHIGEIGQIANETVLIRDAEAEEYPRPTDPETFLDHPRWRYFTAIGLVSPDEVLFVTREHFAWWDTESGKWDYVPEIDTSWQ